MMTDKLSIIVPTLNEASNIRALVERIDASLTGTVSEYEVVFIDDHSTDGTLQAIARLANRYPLRWYEKQGQPGKAQSLLEGFTYARFDLVAILDADLQYPPEALPEMLNRMQGGSDVVVANRVKRRVSFLRRLSSDVFHFVFAKVLHGFDHDVQAGLKLFRKKIIEEFELHPTPWTFDLEFLIRARDLGYHIDWVDVVFEERKGGVSKISLWQAVIEIGGNALALKLRSGAPLRLRPWRAGTMIGAGVLKKRRRFITHTTLDLVHSALQTLTIWQKLLLALVATVVIVALVADPFWTGLVVVGLMSAVYFADVLFNLYVVRRSVSDPPEIFFNAATLQRLDERELPIYSILCPLYREANVLPGFLAAIARLDWPKEKLDVLLLLEEDDRETLATASQLALPPYVRVLVVPDSQPKTKPKACNYGLSQARGEYLVVYDAEDIPEPLQLKKAYAAFQRLPADVACLQAKLNFYNVEQNLLTRLFTAEYSLWFDVILPGLQSVGSTIPLGGTSNHFPTRVLRELEGWDPFNVTEDCDLGVRLSHRGYRTAIIDSVTLEEANSNIFNWLRQRSRWIKGYIQTYLVHTRRWPSGANVRSTLTFHLVVGGKIAFMLFNPILWLATVSYFAWYAFVGPTIESLYPPGVFYMAATSLVFGNFLHIYYYMIGSAKREQWTVIKYVVLVPLYWLLASLAAYRALWQLVWRPHYWEKTLHGLHLPAAAPAAAEVSEPVTAFIPMETATEKVTADTQSYLFSPGGTATDRSLMGDTPAIPQNHSIAPPGIWSDGVVLMLAIMVSHAMNFLFNAFLGRVLELEQLAMVIFVNTVWYIAAIFLGALGATVNHRAASLAFSAGPAASAAFHTATQRKSLLLALGVSALWLAAVPVLARFFHIADHRALIFFAPAVVFGVIGTTNRAYLQGILFFRSVAGLIAIESVSKFSLAVLFVWGGYESLVYVSIPAAVIIGTLVSMWVVQRRLPVGSVEGDQDFPGRFFGAVLLSGISSTLFLSVDLLLVKHFLSPPEAGAYVLLSLLGKMIYFFGSLPGALMLTLTSRTEGVRRSTLKSFQFLFGSSVILVLLGIIALGPLGYFTVPLLLGEKTVAILEYLNAYTIALGLFTLSTVIVLYQLARKRYAFPVASLAMTGVMAVGILFFHESLKDITNSILAASLVGFAVLAVMHFLEPHMDALRRIGADFVGLWSPLPFQKKAAKGKKNILIFNWRDTRHAYAGGGELYIHEIVKRWVSYGHRVTLFCGNDAQSPAVEVVDGVEVIRRGGFYLVYVWAFLYYVCKFRGSYDLIIDCQNGIPFFTPLYARIPIFCLMHHVHKEVFLHSLPKPLAWFAGFLEEDLMPLVYRNIKFITVSESSKHEMRSLRIGAAGIEVVNPGVDLETLKPGKKSTAPTILYLGRLKAYKSVDILVQAFEEVVERAPEARLIIAGRGEEEDLLKQRTRQLRLDLGRQVLFTGRVTEEQKTSYLQQAWVLVNPSMMEGWGITTIEANACATPVVAADVPGLRDSVRNPHTGYLVPHGDPQALAYAMLELLGNEKLRQRMGRRAVLWAKHFDWKVASKKFFTIINQITSHPTESYAIEEF